LKFVWSKKNSINAATKTSENDDVKAAIDKLRGRDRLGNASQMLTTAGGAAAGASAAGALAATAGASTLLGSTTLASAIGGVLVVSTPVGWVVGCAFIGAATAYGVSKLVRSGGRNDRVREEIIDRLLKRLKDIETKKPPLASTMTQLRDHIAAAIRNETLTNEQANRMLDLIEAGKLSVEIALERILALSSADR
jgi:hypothetical protein